MKTERLIYQLDNLTAKFSSDHSPIIVDLFLNATRILAPKPTHSINWTIFEENIKTISSSPSDVSSPAKIDLVFESFINILSGIIANNTTISTSTDYKNDLPKHIKSAISLKRSLWLQ